MRSLSSRAFINLELRPLRASYTKILFWRRLKLKYVHSADERFTVLNSEEYFGRIFRYRVSHCNSTREYQGALACET